MWSDPAVRDRAVPLDTVALMAYDISQSQDDNIHSQ